MLFSVQPAHSSTTSRIDEYYSALTKMEQFSGKVLYYKSGKKEFAKTFGEAFQNKTSFSFRVGSLSKPITATAVLSLVEKKKLDLDARVNTVITNLNIPNSVTTRNLLNQTSGAVYEFSRDVKTEDEFRAALKEMSWNEPGKWVYSNIGYQILGLVVKEISKQSLYSYLEKDVFPKLTLNSVQNLVQGTSIDCGKVSTIDHNPFYDVGSGGVMASPEVIADFFIALNEDKIISLPSKENMLKDPDQNGYGFGMNIKNINGKMIYGHNGSVPGFKSFVMFNEKKDFLLVFNNLEQFPLIQAQKDATLLLTGKSFSIPIPVHRKESRQDSKALMDFVGRYVLDFDANQKLEISYNSVNGHFYMLDEGKKKKLIPDSKNSFFICPTSEDTVYFKRKSKKVFLELTALGGAKFTASRIE